jgi:hypothetical protein
LLITCCAVSLTLWAQNQSPAAPTTVNDNDQLRALYRKAQAAFEAEDFERARGLFLQAWQIQPSADIALGLGQSELELKRYRDCAEHLEYAIRKIPPFVGDNVVETAKKALARAKSQVAVLRATTNREGAEIRLDGRVVGKSPLPAVLFIEPGQHEIAAAIGTNGIARPVSVDAGQEYSIDLPIVAQSSIRTSSWANRAHRSSTIQPAGPSGSPPKAQNSERSPLPVIIGGAAIAAGLTTALVFRLDSDSQFNQANTMRQKLSQTGCSGATAPLQDCAALMGATQSGDRSRNWSTAGFTLAGVALAGTLAYWYWPRSESTPAAQSSKKWMLRAVSGANFSGVSLAGEY